MPDRPPESDPSLPLLSLRGISKSFGAVQANQDVDLDIFPSEVLALLGENGAGKSTLVKILYGFYRADAGTIDHRGSRVSIRSPVEARALRIGMVFQTFTLIRAFTVAENIALFTPDLPSRLDLKAVSERIRDLSEHYHLHVDPQALGVDLPVADQQKVEILKLLISDARVLILDEPTRVLAPHEIDGLLKVLDSLRSDGYAIVLITHKLKEVLQVADRITVMRSGRVAGSLAIQQASEARLIELMFSRPLAEFERAEHGRAEIGEAPLLELQEVSSDPLGTRVGLLGISLTVRPGEIVGITGVSGNGQRELADVVLGRLRSATGSMHLLGEDVTHASIRSLRDRGVAFIPESPMAMAVAPFLTVLENMAVPQLGRYVVRGGLGLDWAAARRDTTAALDRLGFTLPLSSTARSLSGGNLQRLVIARELSHHPKLILASYLTSGLDVRSAIAARQALLQARQQGAGVLLFSDDLDELFSLSDRLIVLQAGRIRGEFSPEETSYEEIGYLMTGSASSHDR